MNGAAAVSVRMSNTASKSNAIMGGRSHHFLLVMKKCQMPARNPGFFAPWNNRSLSVKLGPDLGWFIGTSWNYESVMVGKINGRLGHGKTPAGWPQVTTDRCGGGRRGGADLPLVLTEIIPDVGCGHVIRPVGLGTRAMPAKGVPPDRAKGERKWRQHGVVDDRQEHNAHDMANGLGQAHRREVNRTDGVRSDKARYPDERRQSASDPARRTGTVLVSVPTQGNQAKAE
jgi:hypothetical protein